MLNKHPIIDYPDASISSCVINSKEKKLKFFRNDKRPLWYFYNKNSIIATSTKDIFKRLNIHNPYKCESCLEYQVDFENIEIKKNKIKSSMKDMQ